MVRHVFFSSQGSQAVHPASMEVNRPKVASCNTGVNYLDYCQGLFNMIVSIFVENSCLGVSPAGV